MGLLQEITQLNIPTPNGYAHQEYGFNKQNMVIGWRHCMNKDFMIFKI